MPFSIKLASTVLKKNVVLSPMEPNNNQTEVMENNVKLISSLLYKFYNI